MDMRLISVSAFLFVLFFKGSFIQCQDIGYYWKDYDGSIPVDAFVAGKTKNGQNAYVGRVVRIFSPELTGVVPVQIFPGDKKVTAYYGDGVRVFDKNIEILCGSQASFQWLPTTSNKISSDINGKQVVHGGFLYVANYIGKITDDSGETKIGSVERDDDNNPNSRAMYPILGNKYGNVKSYQVLIYQKSQNGDGGFETSSSSKGNNYYINININKT